MKIMLTVGIISLFCLTLVGRDFETQVMAHFDRHLDALEELEAFEAFIEAHPEYFPAVSFDEPVHVSVNKEYARIDGKRIKIGTSYLQVVLRAEPSVVRQLMESPQWYRDIYDLDRDAFMGPVSEDGSFQAHIYKKVPVIPNQDYVLSFSRRVIGDVWFQRATLKEDFKDFALRDNLKILQRVEGGIVFREVSYVYPLGWLARALSGMARKTMVKELKVMGNALKCIAEKGLPFDPRYAAACWKRFR